MSRTPPPSAPPPSSAPSAAPAASATPVAVATTDALVVDRGYRAWDGEALGIRSVRWAIVVDALRRALGLGRRARSKVLPWAMLLLAVGIALIVTGMYVAVGLIGLPGEVLAALPDHPELFGWYDLLTAVFVSIVGPSMVIPDRRHGVLSLSLSRPLTLADWLRGKVTAFAIVLLAMLLLPQLTMWIGRASVADGFLPYLAESGSVWWRAPVAALGPLLAQGGLLALVVTVVNRPGLATAAFLGTWAVIGPVASLLSELDLPGMRFMALLNLAEHVDVVTNLTFGANQGITALRSAGFDPWMSWVVLATFAATAGWIMVARHRRLT